MSTDGSRPFSSISATPAVGDTTLRMGGTTTVGTSERRATMSSMSDRFPVLIVDDQVPFRTAMKAVLKRTAEFELVGEAADGNEAVALEEELRPALVLMDINMPEMNGIEAARAMVAHHPDVVVILCSTYDAGDLPPEVATSGARAYLNKEHLGADTLRRLWEGRNGQEFVTT